MDTETSAAEAVRLARSRDLLRDGGSGDPLAFWHGTEPGLCVSLHRGGWWLNVYLDDSHESGYVDVSASPVQSGVPLYGSSAMSLPPVDAVFLQGGDAIGDFLAKYDWSRNEPFSLSFPDPVPAAYDRRWQTNCPIYQADVSVMVGGWHMPWPDGDWYGFVDAELVAWTFRDSEPWVEVFLVDSSYVVKQRTT